MTGSASDSERGMIPRALEKVIVARAVSQVASIHLYLTVCLELLNSRYHSMQIFENVQRLKWQEWTYSLECSILEIYNDRIRDLLKPGKEISDQAAIKHDDGERSTQDERSVFYRGS